MLTVTDVHKRFGGVHALNGVSLTVESGQICGLIGPNGSGKSTLFDVISRLQSADSGQVRIGEADVTRARPEAIAGLGVGRAFQIVRPMSGLTCRDNLLAGLLYGAASLDLSSARRRASELLELVGLGPRADVLAGNLSLWEKKALEVARAVSVGHRLLLLDEVFAGLTPGDVDRMIPTVRRLRDDLDATVVLVEHVMRATMALCDRIVVLSSGEIIADGTPQEVVEDERVIEVYLGRHAGGDDDAAG